MKIRHSKKPLPHQWAGLPGADKALFIGHVTVTHRGWLRMKLLVFESRRDLRAFWRDGLKAGDLGPLCLGAVNGLAVTVEKGGRSYLEVDPTYFAVMGLVVGHLGMEIITHESVHAACAYVRRVHGVKWPHAAESDEEKLCYPAGRIASRVALALHENGLAERYEHQRQRRRIKRTLKR